LLELPTVEIYNNESNGDCGRKEEDENIQPRSVCFKITGTPTSTLSLYCGATQVQVYEIYEGPNNFSCLNVTCGENLTVVATNCFANASKIFPGMSCRSVHTRTHI
jgi:hypothetical protein